MLELAFGGRTFDNGKEFAKYSFIASCFEAKVYFCHPFYAWERGNKENANGLLLQPFPKYRSLKDLCPSEVDDAEYLLNDRTCKCLVYRTAHPAIH